MSELKVEMTDTFSLAKSEMDNLLYRKSSMKAEKLVNEFNKALDRFAKVFSKRFVMTEGKSGMILLLDLSFRNLKIIDPFARYISEKLRGRRLSMWWHRQRG